MFTCFKNSNITLFALQEKLYFRFLEEIPLEKLHSTVPNFGNGSIIKTHIHVADCYRYWLGSFAFKQKRADFSFASDDEIEHADVEKVRARFKLVDKTVQRFLEEYNDRWLENIANEVKWQKRALEHNSAMAFNSYGNA